MTERNYWRGMLLGALGGAAGTLAMGYYFQAVSKLSSGQGQGGADEGDSQSHALDEISLVGKHYREGEGSTLAVGRLAYSALAGHEPRRDETRTLLSELVHWGFGTSMGALYGLIREGEDGLDLLGGAAFGAGVWLFASELMLPLLGLAPGPTAQPAAKHGQELGAHLVYGAVAAATTRALEGLLEAGAHRLAGAEGLPLMARRH